MSNLIDPNEKSLLPLINAENSKANDYGDLVLGEEGTVKALLLGEQDFWAEGDWLTTANSYLEMLELESFGSKKYQITPEEHRAKMQATWNIPKEYLDIDVMAYIIERCPEENMERCLLELIEFQERGLENFLRTLIWLVDTMRANNIFWGVGRGSSVASYVLFLIGIIRVDPVKWEIPMTDFFRNA